MLKKYGPGWVDGWMGGWVDGWVDGRAVLRIAYSNKKNLNFQPSWKGPSRFSCLGTRPRPKRCSSLQNCFTTTFFPQSFICGKRKYCIQFFIHWGKFNTGFADKSSRIKKTQSKTIRYVLYQNRLNGFQLIKFVEMKKLINFELNCWQKLDNKSYLINRGFKKEIKLFFSLKCQIKC